MKVLQDKDGYRRHLEEQHLGLHGRRVNKEYVPIGTRISMYSPLDSLRLLTHSRTSARRDQEIRDTEGGEGRKTNEEKKRGSKEEDLLGSSFSEEEEETKKRHRAKTVQTENR
jgi:hypothetical protein